MLPHIRIRYSVFNQNMELYHQGVFWLDNPTERRAVSERFTDAHQAGHLVMTESFEESPAEASARMERYSDVLRHRFKVIGKTAAAALIFGLILHFAAPLPDYCNANDTHGTDVPAVCVD